MRVLALVEALGEGEPVAWVEALAAIVARAHLIDDADALLAARVHHPRGRRAGLPYETRQQLYAAAVDRGLPAIARLFLVASPAVVAASQLSSEAARPRALAAADAAGR